MEVCILCDRFPIKENDKERIINDFKTTKFACIRCGSRDIETITTKPYADGINIHGRNEHTNHNKEIELTFYVTALLFCGNWKHRFHVKILDQGIRNTDEYFDNTLT